MHRIDGYGHHNNHFRAGNPTTVPPTPPTEVTADWLETQQEEIANVVEAAGIELDKADNTQLLLAINALINAKLGSGGGGSIPNCDRIEVNAEGYLVCVNDDSGGGGSNVNGTGFDINSAGELLYESDGQYTPLQNVEFAVDNTDLTATGEPTPSHVDINETTGQIEVTE